MLTDHTRHSRPMTGARVQSLRTPLVTVVTLALLAVATLPVRDALYLAVARAAESSPIAPLVGLVAGQGLVLLVAVAAVAAVTTWRSDRPAFWTLVSAGAGTIAAYVASEGIKLVVGEERPCRTLDVETVLACPAAGDWSWPSNHSVLAAAFATACVLALPRTRVVVVPLTLLVAASRVAAGVHYPHDVLSGLALGTLVVILTVAALRPLVDRVLRRR